MRLSAASLGNFIGEIRAEVYPWLLVMMAIWYLQDPEREHTSFENKWSHPNRIELQLNLIEILK